VVGAEEVCFVDRGRARRGTVRGINGVFFFFEGPGCEINDLTTVRIYYAYCFSFLDWEGVAVAGGDGSRGWFRCGLEAGYMVGSLRLGKDGAGVRTPHA